jgi:hypothetical protein
VENDDESNDDEYGDAGCWHGMAGRRQARQQVLQHDAHIDRSTMVLVPRHADVSSVVRYALQGSSQQRVSLRRRRRRR